ncbi:hypothetical protein CEXT_604011 [Caerostris extrusa]|uniref:Uncharacterized protein n=1 Tax=Caerostris extrusa TaxID=172846 RepID=A0AAV4SWW8_CAEEX|nr:hypothetical protein CEXT_604011 [Caerostris extrusa]
MNTTAQGTFSLLHPSYYDSRNVYIFSSQATIQCNNPFLGLRISFCVLRMSRILSKTACCEQRSQRVTDCLSSTAKLLVMEKRLKGIIVTDCLSSSARLPALKKQLTSDCDN